MRLLQKHFRKARLPLNTTSSPNSEITSSAQGQAILLFPTVCFVVEHNDTVELNEELKAFCLQEEKSAAGIQSGSIEGGYHSARQLFDSENAAIQQLKKMLLDDAKQYMTNYWKQESTTSLESLGEFSMRMSGWSVILRQGNVSKPHTHPGAQLSGVYYVSTQEDQNSGGELVLADPRIRATVAPLVGQKSNAVFQPKSGITVLFPSYLEHYVLPFRGSGERISIAYNVMFSPNALQSN